jgi:hypothetical protein
LTHDSRFSCVKFGTITTQISTIFEQNLQNLVALFAMKEGSSRITSPNSTGGLIHISTSKQRVKVCDLICRTERVQPAARSINHSLILFSPIERHYTQDIIEYILGELSANVICQSFFTNKIHASRLAELLVNRLFLNSLQRFFYILLCTNYMTQFYQFK